jgi:8-oxo-dGTP pyrophosphatase MutT (NUDIX family)
MPIVKVFCYIVRRDQDTPKLLVFWSLDEPGFEVPKGSVEPGETLGQAALREIFEESGISALRVVKELGVTQYGDEEQHFLLLEAAGDLAASFTHVVTGCGVDEGFHYDFQWFDVTVALHRLLVQGCDRFVATLVEELQMHPDPSSLLEKIDLDIPLIGFYDAPDTSAFGPLVKPKPGRRACVFSFYEDWLNGATLHITKDNYGCGGAGRWLCDVQTRDRDGFVRFLVDDEGLKASHELMHQWLDVQQGYQQDYADLFIGPLREEQYAFLKTVTFYVNPDQLSVLMLGAQYHSAPGDPPPVITPFGSGCSQLVGLFADLSVAQAIVGATDIAMRQHLPPDIVAFTTTKPMFEQLCTLDEKSFLHKPFWRNLMQARGLAGS